MAPGGIVGRGLGRLEPLAEVRDGEPNGRGSQAVTLTERNHVLRLHVAEAKAWRSSERQRQRLILFVNATRDEQTWRLLHAHRARMVAAGFAATVTRL